MLDAERFHVAASFQAAVVDVLAAKTLRAVEQTRCSRILLGGGVSANKRLREEFKDRLAPEAELFHASPRLSIDNGAMVARVGVFRLERGEIASWNSSANPNLPFPGLMRISA